MEQNVSNALARKVTAGRTGSEDQPRSVPRALRLGFAKAASDQLNLPLAVIGVKQGVRPQDDLIARINSEWLLLLFQSVDCMAAVCLDPGLVAAIVQHQTFGEVMAGKVQTRAFTDTDAAMVAPLVEGALGRAVGLVEADADKTCLTGFEFSSRAADPRSMCLMMVKDAYLGVELTVDVAHGLRQGQIAVFLPLPDANPESVDGATDVETPRLEQSVGVLRAELNAVLCKLTLPLNGLSSLEVGGILPLNTARLETTEFHTIDRVRAGVGRLGQCGGMRAVRLNEHTSPALRESDALEFIERESGAPGRDADYPSEAEVPAMTVIGAEDTQPAAGSPVGDFVASDTRQLAAEISDLAGLPGPDEGPE